jgi:hypothetical protein
MKKIFTNEINTKTIDICPIERLKLENIDIRIYFIEIMSDPMRNSLANKNESLYDFAELCLKDMAETNVNKYLPLLKYTKESSRHCVLVAEDWIMVILCCLNPATLENFSNELQS